MFKKSLLHQLLISLIPTFLAKLPMQSTDSKLGLLLEDAHTALEEGVKRGAVKMDMQLEIRTLSFWRALTAECISTFLYVLLVCCVHQTVSITPDLHISSGQAYCGIVSGLAIISLTTIFLPVSGAHTNPAISLAAALIHRISPLRSVAHVVAQCGGAIAGASVVLGLYGASEHFPTITVTNFGLEFLLSFMIVLVYLRVTDHSDDNSKIDPAISIGLSYMAALTAYKGALNPALALGQAFAVSKFTHHWVFWVGPILGGSCAALCHEYVFNEEKDVHLSLTNVKSVEEKLEEIEPQTKDPEEQAPSTPPLPWNIRRPTRSYSSEMISRPNYPRENDDARITDWESYEQDPCKPPVSSAYRSASSSKHHNGHQKTPSANRKGAQQEYNGHSLTRSQSQKHPTKTRKSSTHPIPKDPQRKPVQDSHFYVDY